MKNYYILTAIMLIGLSACTTASKDGASLSSKDRALLMETRDLAQDAKRQSSKALDEAKNARETANRAAMKADRIFRESQVK
ncbi:hypothetical protein N9W34_00430 [Rickettsiales bacterium]|nr:hypothetical protein [Rickettsiales bacterium]